MDATTAVLVFGGVVLLAGSWIQLIFTATAEDFTWGLCSVFLPPLAYFYGLFEWSKAGDAIKMAIVGLVMIGCGLA